MDAKNATGAMPWNWFHLEFFDGAAILWAWYVFLVVVCCCGNIIHLAYVWRKTRPADDTYSRTMQNAGCSMGDQLRVSVCVSQSISTTFCILGHTIERNSRGQRLCLRGRTMLGVPDVSGFASRGQGYHWGSAVDTG